jgi:hypothetical protein
MIRSKKLGLTGDSLGTPGQALISMRGIARTLRREEI